MDEPTEEYPRMAVDTMLCELTFPVLGAQRLEHLRATLFHLGPPADWSRDAHPLGRGQIVEFYAANNEAVKCLIWEVGERTVTICDFDLAVLNDAHKPFLPPEIMRRPRQHLIGPRE